MKLKTLLLATVATVCLSTTAFADDAAILARLDAMQKQIEAQNRQIETQAHEIAKLRGQLTQKHEAAGAPMPAPAAVASQQQQIDALKSELTAYKTAEADKAASEPKLAYKNGRPTISSPDGRFTFSVRGLAQMDMGYYDQSASAARLAATNGPSLGSGVNFRRAAIGFQGKLFGDWSYLFNYDFGGSGGNENQGRIQSVYLQYDGLKPFAIRAGAYPPPASLEDSTSATNTIFMERNSPADAARAIAGADGRDAISLLYADDRLFAALSWTGGKVADKSTFAGEQNALMGRVSDLFYSDDDWKFLGGVNGTYVFNPPYTNVAGTGGTHNITLSSAPELTVDNTGTKFVSTGAINANHVTQWGLEGAAQWRSLYGQAGYFAYEIDRADGLSNPNFDGWYLQGSWVMTGERRGYSAASGAFTAPKPSSPFSLSGGGMGAWEMALRYSDLDLNYHEGTAGIAASADAVRGGEQRIWTWGLNWYPNNLLRFTLNLSHIDVDRLGTTANPVIPNADVGQSLNTVALRTQFGF